MERQTYRWTYKQTDGQTGNNEFIAVCQLYAGNRKKIHYSALLLDLALQSPKTQTQSSLAYVPTDQSS